MASPTKHSKTVRRRKRATNGKGRKAELRRSLKKQRTQHIDVL